MDSLEALIAEHLREPFPVSVEKGLDYGEVDPVMVGADIYGWALKASSGELSSDELARLRPAREALKRSLSEFPAEARPYYQHLVRLALAAEERGST